MSNGTAEDSPGVSAQLDALRAELALSRRDLDGFAHAVSHDLRSPLSVMLGFADLIRERAVLPAGDPAHAHLDEILRAGERINAMISALLLYVRSGQAPITRVRVPISELARKVWRDIGSGREGASGGLVEIEALSPVLADPSLLEVLLKNLLGNALRFADPGDPRVRFGRCAELAGEVFFVQDNGQGFDPKQRERLFLPFQHLSAGQQGAGVGLATCARIAHRHGGQIWAGDHPERGARFFFTLSAANPQVGV